jgi:predicted phosphoserine aminotransferase
MVKLFLPGPTDVDSQVLAAQSQPMIGHRSQECVDLISRIHPKLQQVFATQSRVFLSTSSGTGLQEAAMRNCVNGRVLVGVCGAFGDRWHQVALENGLPADRIDVQWGLPIAPELVADTLTKGDYDTLAIVHNETSTGGQNPIDEIAHVARRVNPDIIILVDAVSSAGGVEIKTDDWYLDVVLTSSQKCFALPPGLAFAAVSDRALARAKQVKNRGWYFDFLRFQRYHERSMTPTTPAISLLYALDRQLDRMLNEGLENRYHRHETLAGYVQSWAESHFTLFAQEGSRSKTVTAINNTRAIDVSDLNSFLMGHGMLLANGYGPLKEKTFRIGHMGETSISELKRLIQLLDNYLDNLGE